LEKNGAFMTNTQLMALHGFLGKPTDWDCFNLANLKAIDLFSSITWTHLWDWAKQFNQVMLSHPERNILMGYSLGGRLALHALIQNPSLWRAGIIISAHPGLQNPEEKQKRLIQDREWANRFKTEDWQVLMKEWNNQAVLASGCFKFDRLEADYSRENLASFLEKGSVGYQDDLRVKIGQLPMPILWIVGQQDRKYQTLAQSLTFSHSQSKLLIFSEAGHRAPWEKFNQFKDQLNQFIDKLG
jgi:2-succinyl-6-hydroxy-2,4-cyclohexadiene-1-carboxylate synthase